MKKFDDNFLEFIKENILIEDLARNVYDLIEHKKRSTKQYPVFVFTEEDLKEKGSVKIVINNAKNAFFTHNYNARGTSIDFVQYVENCDFVTAVKKISSYYNIDIQNENVEFNSDYIKNNVNLQRSVSLKNKVKEAAIETERKAQKWIEMYNTLRINRHFTESVRGISAELLNYLRDNGKLKFYKTDKYAVIKVPMYRDSIEMCGGQDIYRDKNGKWQKINHGRAGIYVTGNLKNVTTLTLTESAFDSLSALQLKLDKTKAKNPFYDYDDLNNDLSTISINGSLSDLKKEAILDVIRNAESLETIIFAFDADEVGKKYVDEVTQLLKENGLLDKYNVITITFGDKKDLNEYLQAKKLQDSAAPNNSIKAAGEREKEAFIAR